MMITPRKPQEEIEYILVTDVGSTTTKARLFHCRDGEYRFLIAGEAPTTVEAPYEDVTLGVRNAVREIEELTGHQILSFDGSGIIVPYDGKAGVDFYCTTSSAGGGLQMMVTGVVSSMSAASSNRAGLGAGAIVMDIIASDDGRPDHLKINRIRNLRPDMILIAGGTDGGTVRHVLDITQLINAAEPKARLGLDYKMPVVFAGNKNARQSVEKILSKNFSLSIVENIRPSLEHENTEPARRAIHELFMEHVMSHAPGYPNLMKWTDIDIMPTPAGEGIAITLIARLYNANVLGVGLGGATTNVYSIVDDRVVRSVSANLGMSYSICNVLKEAGLENIRRWIPFDVEDSKLENTLWNKMIRPTTIPHTIKDLIVEHAVAREALRLGLMHHKTIATRLKGVLIFRDLSTILDQAIQESYIDMMIIDVIAGTGGLLSHSPRRQQSMLILTDAFQPEGVTKIFQDSVFMMPHLGVLSTAYPDAASQIFDKDCLVRLGTIIAPKGITKEGNEVARVRIEMPDGDNVEKTLYYGEITYMTLHQEQEARVIISPQKSFDVGEGIGKQLETTVIGGVVGLVFDARGRPLSLPTETETRKNKLIDWFNSLDLYPMNFMENL